MNAETLEIRQARQRAAVKWLLSKAFNNNVPDNLKEPFYRDHENQERLKPQIIVELGNATLYCQTLSNLYSDPNYQSLNHWSILQMLARKGVPVAESSDMPLTETVLIQTNPLRLNSHMAVVESLMILYAKEISSGDRIANAIRRISSSNYTTPSDQSYEQSLLTWVSHVCAALHKRILMEVEAGATDEQGVRLQAPVIPPVRTFQDLCDGICLALLIAYYCPKLVPWTSVRINYLPSVEDSIHNLMLLSNFSQKHLPYNVFHMKPEDITYIRGSMKLSIVVLLADLFNLFEIHPAKCVCHPGMNATASAAAGQIANEHGIIHRRGLTSQPVTPIPNLRSELDNDDTTSNRPPFQVSASVSTHNNSTYSSTPSNQFHNMDDTNNYEAFVVHKSRGITTLSTMHHSQQQQQQQQQDPLIPARLRQSKEHANMETKADERGDSVPAGMPSNWEQNRRPSYAGRRSRRNSSSEDSQLTIENFGGSQDQINMIGRFDRERDRERERKLSSASIEPAVAVRSSIADARGTIQLGYDTDSGSEKQDRETEKYTMRRQASVDNVTLLNSSAQLNNSNPTTNTGSPIPSTHYQHQKQHSIEKDYGGGGGGGGSGGSSSRDHPHHLYEDALKSGQQYDYDDVSMAMACRDDISVKSAPLQNNHSDPYDENMKTLENASKLSTIRMKLEEKQRRIEQDKRKIELALLRHQEKLSQEDKESSADMFKWETLSNETIRTPDIDPVDLDKYQDIQQDIQRLATQQNQIQAQHIQAQQLMQAQQFANMLNQQQTYGSQQHLADNHHQRSMQQQHQNFGSTPHLPHAAFNTPINTYNSRPPSRDSYQTQQQQMQPMVIPFVNEHGQYMSPTQQHQHQNMMQQQQQQQPIYMQPQSIYSDNAMGAYNNHNAYGGGGIGASPQYLPKHVQQSQQQQQQQQQQYVNRQSMIYDDLPPSSHQQHMLDGKSPNQYYMREVPTQSPPQRRVWSQPSYEMQQPLVDVNAWQTQKNAPFSEGYYTWGKQQGQQQHPLQQQQHPVGAYIVSQGGSGGGSSGGGGSEYMFQVHSSPQHGSASPGGNIVVQRQQSFSNIHDNRSPSVMAARASAAVTQLPSDDMMAPQSICFIGDEEDVDEIQRNLIDAMQSARISDYAHKQQLHSERGSSSEEYDSNRGEILPHKLNVTAGNLTYRIPSPSRPHLHANSFQDPRDNNTNEKGFYISFDDDQPKRPKPPLRGKRSPKKEQKNGDSVDHQTPPNSKRDSYISQFSHNNHHVHHHHHHLNNSNSNNANSNNNNNNNDKNYDHNMGVNNATYNKYNDTSIQLSQLAAAAERRLMDTMDPTTAAAMSSNSHQAHSSLAAQQQQQNNAADSKSKALIIGTDVTNLDPTSVDEMERRKEKIMLLSLQRRQQQEEMKARKELESAQQRERSREKEEERARKKQEQMERRAQILQQHRLKKAMEEAEREGKTLDRSDLHLNKPQTSSHHHSSSSSSEPRLRQQRLTRPRPKTIHVDDASVDISEASSISSRGKKGSSSNLTGYGQLNSNTLRRDYYRGSQDSLTVKESPDEYPSTSSTPIGRRGSYKTSREPTFERGRTLSRISVAKGSTLNFRGRKSNSLMNLCDSGLGRATPPRRAPSPGMSGTTGRHMPSPSGPGSLPPGLISKRRGFDDGSSDISSSNQNSMLEYSGPKLYKQPTAKSNRGIILNAVEYCVFPGAVNREAKQKVLEKVARSEAKHFLILFRDAGCQFRALYSYVPETNQVSKLYGTGPSQVDEVMFDKFFKYNSGGKCFSQVHTKHLTVTIDAFTIHNSLWQGKKVHLPSKKDMALII